ncbi:hypothetical protein BKA65DRAFT_126079 [Rhexocercosporidium sp. MPI-PUGE-AT-0058]|nr:hypothetical protein BKA65DRAFT_126079 [Rhexocercosporidium sp. MPI-PUGE-AT-0058]
MIWLESIVVSWFVVTSIPACRKTLRAGKNDRYFDFKQLKSLHTVICLIIFHKLYSIAIPGYPRCFRLNKSRSRHRPHA